ncbi:MAG: GNAT family N-acetyltransferase [Actinomycetota bacterium]|nr:GNAT family N-acetyltransferase [Actinomycetota bacterium]
MVTTDPSEEPVELGLTWRGSFTSLEANALHAEAFETRLYDASEWDWEALTARHSLGWVTARAIVDDTGAGRDDRLVGFVNVLWDGFVHAWIQDVMVARSHRHRGVGVALVRAAADGARAAGCEWLHVDFDDDLRPFYVDACGFEPASAALLDLTREPSPSEET